MRDICMAAVGMGVSICAAASGAVVHVDISGAFVPTLGHGGSPYGIVTSLSTYDASFEYDTTLPTASALLNMSVVLHNPTGDVSIGAETLTGNFLVAPFNFPSPNIVSVTANPVGEPDSGDRIQASASHTTGPGANAQLFTNLFAGVGNHPLNGVGSLPTTIDPSFLSSQSYFQVLVDFNNFAQGTIATVQTSLVPAPTGVAAILIGAGAMMRRRRR